MMRKFPYRMSAFAALVVAGIGLAGCEAKEPTADDAVAALQADNTMTCVSGGETFSGKGAEVGIASLGGNGKQLNFGVPLMVGNPGSDHFCPSTGVRPLLPRGN